MSKDQVLDAIGAMSVLELSELIKAMEEKFGVSAAAAAEYGLVDKVLSNRAEAA